MALPYKPLNVSVIEIGKLWEMKFLYEEKKKTTKVKNYLNPLKFAADIDLFPGRFIGNSFEHCKLAHLHP